MSSSFAEVLRAFREERSLTQEELAERAGITVKAVGALERGERRRPYPHTVRSLADALDLDGDERAALVASVPARGPVAAGVTVAARPSPEGPMVGRDVDLEVVVAALRSPSRPVVTLTGPGGVGKTTLALAAAGRVGTAFPGGVVVVELADATTPEAVLTAVAAALGVPEAGFAGSVTELVPYVEGRRVLLVLDNLEQVLDCAADVAALVRHCPDLVALATSRAPLRIRAEQEIRVSPLDEGSAVELFLERLKSTGLELDVGPEVTELCRRLDGLPLALELAASAAVALGPSNLLDHLGVALGDGPRDLPERQRSMTATLVWSLDLVGARERDLLQRLSILPGTFSLAAAESVFEGPAAPELRRLVEHSLVARSGDVRGAARFRLLEPVRQHVAELLPASTREAATTALTGHVQQLVTRLSEDLKGVEVATALDLLEADFGQIRIAYHRLVDEARHDAAAELAWRLWIFLTQRGHAREGLAWLHRLHGVPMGDRARVHWQIARSGLDYLVGDIASQRRHGEAAVTLAQRIGSEDLAAEAAILVGSAALFAGDLVPARAALEAARRHGAEAHLDWLEAHALIALGQVALLAQDAGAEQAMVDAVATARALGNPFTLALGLNVLATWTALQGQHTRTATLLAESAALSIDARMSWTLAYTLPALAGVAVRLGRTSSGAWLFGASASYSAQHSIAANFQASRELADSDLAAARQQLGEEAFRAAWDAGRDATGGQVVDRARDLIRGGPD